MFKAAEEDDWIQDSQADMFVVAKDRLKTEVTVLARLDVLSLDGDGKQEERPADMWYLACYSGVATVAQIHSKTIETRARSSALTNSVHV